MVSKLRLRLKKMTLELQRQRGKTALHKDKKSELEEVLIDAIDKTRLQIFKRKLAQEKGTKQKALIKRVQELSQEIS